MRKDADRASLRAGAPDILAALGGLALAVGGIYLLVRVLDGARLFMTEPVGTQAISVHRQVQVLPWLILVLLGGLALGASWIRMRADRAALGGERSRRLEAEKRARRVEGERDDARERATTAEAGLRRVERDRRVEREWNRELRERLGTLLRERRSLADMDDIRSLVLHTAVSLLDAEKGILLERTGGGELKVSRAEGFEHDPTDARLVRRLARQVLDRDRILREDSIHEQPEATAADREVDNLVAIPLYIADQFHGVVVAADREGGFDEHDDEVLLALGDHAGAVLDNSRLQAELRSSYLGSVRMLTEAIEAKDSSLRGHAEDVLGYVMAVAERLDLDGAERENLLFGSLLHDVGKIGISERILAKPGPLTPEERSIIELHPRIGYRMVEQVPGLREVGLAVLHHHERWDGDGYPAGLRGEEISLAGRIVSVADTFDAMTTDRPYRQKMSLEDACAELERCAGAQFDPEIVGLFLAEVRRRPPEGDADGALATALEDPELAHRARGEGLVGGAAAVLSDPLTLLYGRRWFDAALDTFASTAAVRDEPFTIVMVELSGLEEINRTEGLEAGDAALVGLARAVARAADRVEGSACRYSGARLAVLVPSAGPTVDATLALLGDELATLPGEPRCTATIGVPGEDGRATLARTREALHTGAVVRPTA